MKKTLIKFSKGKGVTLVIVIAVVVIFFSILKKEYLSWDNIRGIMYAMSLTGTITCGMACLMMSGSIDLASGAEGMMGGLVCAMLIARGMAFPLAIVLCLLMGAVFGLINAFLSNVMNFMPFIATMAMSSVWQGVGAIISGNSTIMITDRAFWKIGATNLWIFPLPFIVMVVLLLVYGWLISNTKIGRQLLLCGGNRNAARLAGINFNKISTIFFVNNGVIACIGGIILASRMHNGTVGNVVGAEMDGMVAAIIGGVSFLGGGSSGMGVLFLGILMLTCFKSGLYIINLNAYWMVCANGVLLVIALIVDFLRERARLRSLKAAPHSQKS
ncbi:MAG: ABC transporter permease [Oscillospiraceae bacterium]|jgi:ribose/xylose/arabinose/galactoside ABC-type transport system permease subunit|nr:ABC transporter permease [Oscillospiraceae bacterium]